MIMLYIFILFYMHVDHVDESLFLMFIFDFVLFIMSLELNLYSTIKV